MPRKTSARPDFTGIARSRVITYKGREHAFPVRADYLAYLASRAFARDEQSVLRDAALVKAAQGHWHFTGQNGCRFAQFLAADRDKFGWATEVCVKALDASAAARLVNRCVEKAAANREIQALSVIFPQMTEARQVVDLFRHLAALKGWTVDEVNQTDAPNIARIHAAVRINQSGVMSWLLGFGPFEFLPLTRQAPFVELSVMVKPKTSPPRHPKLNSDQSLAHLADLNVPLNDETYDMMFGATRANKMQILGGADLSAKAKIAYSFPKSEWSRQ